MLKTITSERLRYNENEIYYFLKKVNVKKICKSIVNIFAEARYKLYINGALAAVGPCKQTSEIKYYDSVDISKFLKEGENLIKVSVLQLASGVYTKKETYLESVMRNGSMLMCLWGNAGDTELISDESWEAAKENGIEFFFKPDYDFYNVTALCENVSVRYKKNLEFEKAVCAGNVYRLDEETGTCSEMAIPLQKRPIPMMYFDKKSFVNEKDSVYDAGKLTCGYIRLHCSGKGKIKIIYAESRVFKEEGRIIKRRRDDENGIIIGDYDLIEADGEIVFEPFWMKTFRYIKLELSGDIRIESFDYLETGYPIEISDQYDFGNDKDNKLFEISVNALKRCMHETYVDCPYYEQLQYTMDTYEQIMFTYQLTTDKALPEKAIDDFAKSYRAGGLTQSRFPTNKSQYIPGFSLFFIFMLYQHYKRFSDKKFVRKYIHIADGILDWFLNRLDGYMVERSNMWDFIDYADGYDSGQILTREPIAVYSLMLVSALDKTSRMHNFLGSSISDYARMAENIKMEIKSRCFDAERGLYADSPSKGHFAQHTQIWAVLCGLEAGEKAKNILRKSMELDCKATPAYMFFLFRAMEKAGIYYDFIDKYMSPLREFVDLGCTTTPELSGENVRSDCHAWSAAALYEFTAKILGVTYEDGTIYIKPFAGNRPYAKGEVAVPSGMVYCEWKNADGKFTIKIKLPDNKKAILTMPDGSEMTVDSGFYSCLF